MSTETTTAETTTTEKAPANITVAQLGAMLNKSSRPATQAAGRAAAAAPAGQRAAASETPPPQKEETEGQPADESQTDGDEEPTEEVKAEGAEALAGGDGEKAGGEDDDEAEDEHEAEPEPERKALPPELAAAIAEAKDGGEKGKAQLLKRVHKLVDARDTERMGRLNAERETEALRSQVQELQSKPGRPVAAGRGSDPVLSHEAVQKVQTELNSVDAYLTWADQNPDGGELVGEDGKAREFTAAQVTSMKRNAERLRQELVAEKAQTVHEVKQAHEQAYQNFHGVAVKAYPWIAKADAPESVELKRFLQVMPGLKSFPDHELVLGDYFRGRSARQTAEKNGGATRKPAAREPAKIVADTGATPTRKTTAGKAEGKEVAETRTQFEKSGKVTDLAKSFAARRRLNVGR